MKASHDPQRIERVGETGLKVLWSDGHESLYTWRLLRSSCPCAACREGGEAAPPAASAGGSLTTALGPASEVKPLELQPVGRYALSIRWSDGHATGIFSHEYLRSICPCEACRPGQFTEG
ncbi:MAG: DUF971 domain-containing protein [Candidatus Omnitrophica bacterium]|nr:DUF971 domain-containing protein [Candidatus Omnitrophota bacterium]